MTREIYEQSLTQRAPLDIVSRFRVNREPVAVQVARSGQCVRAGFGRLRYTGIAVPPQGLGMSKKRRTGYSAVPRNRTCDTLHQDGLCGTEQRNGANSIFQ